VGSSLPRRPAPSMKYAILIDGGFVRRKLGSRLAPLDAGGIASFLNVLRSHEALSGMCLHRIYWYDAPPLSIKVRRPLAGGNLDFRSTPLGRASRKLHDDLCHLPFVAVRKGECVFRGWQVRSPLPEDARHVTLSCSDFAPNIQQKGVDMRLGLDIAALTLKAHVGVIVLVAGDSDFVPAMKFARREGAQIYLATLRHAVRREMLEHADLVLDGDSCIQPTDFDAGGATTARRLDEPSSRPLMPPAL